jgi:hypothetical protein
LLFPEFERRPSAVSRLKIALLRGLESVLIYFAVRVNQLRRYQTRLDTAKVLPLLVDRINKVDEMKQLIVGLSLQRRDLDNAAEDKVKQIGACQGKIDGLKALAGQDPRISLHTTPSALKLDQGYVAHGYREMSPSVQALHNAERSIRELAAKAEAQESALRITTEKLAIAMSEIGRWKRSSITYFQWAC